MSAYCLGLLALWLAAATDAGPAASTPPSGGHTAAPLHIVPLVESLRAVGPNGAGHQAAAAAWAELVRADANQLPAVLSALDGAGPLAANWIRTAVDTIAERQLRTGNRLPAADLERFVLDVRHDPRGRRLAYEWLLRADPSARDRLIPGMLNDPSLELRRDAVARRMAEGATAAQANKSAEAIAIYREALAASRDLDQTAQVAERLRKLGQPIDLARQMGYVVRWRLIGPFDNTGGRGFAALYPPEKELRPEASYPGKHGPARWNDYLSTDDSGKVDFNKAFAEEKAVAAYALTEFQCEKAREVEVRMTSPNAVKLWVNGRPAAEFHFYHTGSQPDQYVSRVVLQPGKNTMLVKVCQNELTAEWAREWCLRLRVCDGSGAAVLSADRDQAREAKP